MRTQVIKTESSFFTNFKNAMYALMVIVIAIAIPVLSYLELSYNTNSEDQKENVKLETLASKSVKTPTGKI